MSDEGDQIVFTMRLPETVLWQHPHFFLMHVFVLLKSGSKEASDIRRQFNESLYWLLFELVFICAIPRNKVTGIVGLSHPERASLTHCLLFMRYVMENEFLNIPTITPHQRVRGAA